MKQLELFEAEVKELDIKLTAFDFDIHLRINSKSNNKTYLKANYYIWNTPRGCTLDNEDMAEWFKFSAAPNLYPYYLFMSYASDLDFKKVFNKRRSAPP